MPLKNKNIIYLNNVLWKHPTNNMMNLKNLIIQITKVLVYNISQKSIGIHIFFFLVSNYMVVFWMPSLPFNAIRSGKFGSRL